MTYDELNWDEENMKTHKNGVYLLVINLVIFSAKLWKGKYKYKSWILSLHKM